MANEIVSTTTTLAGLMERVQADAIATFTQGSRLFEAVWAKPANGANVVQFWQSAVPSGVLVSAQTEANALTAAANTKTAKPATLVTYPYETIVSKLALEGGQYTSSELSSDVITYVGAGIDRAICAQIDDFTTQVSGTMSLALFNTAKAALANKGWVGSEIISVMGEGHWGKLNASLVSNYIPVTNEQLIQTGYVGTVLGVRIYTVPDSYLNSTGTHYKWGMYHRHVGIGMGYAEPLIRVELTPYDTANVRFGGFALAGVTEINVEGGIEGFSPVV